MDASYNQCLLADHLLLVIVRGSTASIKVLGGSVIQKEYRWYRWYRKLQEKFSSSLPETVEQAQLDGGGDEGDKEGGGQVQGQRGGRQAQGGGGGIINLPTF